MEEPLNHGTGVADQLFDRLMRMVLSGSYQPGEKLPAQRTLAAEFGVTMTALREAIKRLEQIGLIEVRHGEAMRVADIWQQGGLDVVAYLLMRPEGIDYQLFEHVFEARAKMLEELARLAAQRRSDKQGQEIMRLAHRFAGEEDPAVAQMIDFRFFSALVQAAGNLVFVLIMNSIRDAYLANAHRLPLSLNPDGLAPLYLEIAEAVVNQDSEQAGDLVAELAQQQWQRVAEALGGVEDVKSVK